MREIKTFNIREMKNSYKALLAFFGIVIIAFGISVLNAYGIICGALILLAVLFKRNAFLGKEGIVITHSILLFKHVEECLFADIKSILRQSYPKDAGKVALQLGKDKTTTMLVVTRKDAAEIIRLAKLKNDDIFLEDF